MTNIYNPNPVDTTSVVLDETLLGLTEEIAENVHEVWALARKKEGWVYGPKKDSDKKETPCMVPYKELTDEEKAYDRNTAMETLKLITKLGYKIIK